jgi:hypothetical protein
MSRLRASNEAAVMPDMPLALCALLMIEFVIEGDAIRA